MRPLLAFLFSTIYPDPSTSNASSLSTKWYSQINKYIQNSSNTLYTRIKDYTTLTANFCKITAHHLLDCRKLEPARRNVNDIFRNLLNFGKCKSPKYSILDSLQPHLTLIYMKTWGLFCCCISGSFILIGFMALC